MLLKTKQGLCLVNTGYGLRDARNLRSRLSGFFLSVMSPDFREETTAVRQIEHLQYQPAFGDFSSVLELKR